MLTVAELVDAPGCGPGTHRVCMFKSCRPTHVSLAQLVEHRTFNPQVARSNRAGDTTYNKFYRRESMRKHDLDSINLSINRVESWNNEKYMGLDIYWNANIGFGLYRFFLDKNNPEEWLIESETMDGKNEDGTIDKDFGRKLLNMWLDSMKVIS